VGVPDDFDARERQELADLIVSAGIVTSSAEEPVVDWRGRQTPWGLYTPNISLTQRGLLLVGRALLAELATFRSTQLASFGHTAVPLLSACVLLGDGRYSGLSIRDKPKPYLNRRRVDGPVDVSKPVVVIDDSISSGRSLYRSIQVLEAEGLDVEGAVALVIFPYRGGAEWAYRSGYRVEAVFDIWRDLGMAQSYPQWRPRPIDPRPQGSAVEPGLPPPVAARRIAESYLASGVPPRPPENFDGEYDDRGGVFVSFRDRKTEHRVAREGFWHFDAEDARPTHDLVAATVQAIQASAGAVSRDRLAALKIAVTFFGPLERITPAQLDFEQYGIVVRDGTFGQKLGGALPNTQVFVTEMEQYEHARKRNAGLARTEPHELYRHVVVKLIEPGETWLPYGSPDGPELAWQDDCSIGQALVDRVRSVIDGSGEPGGPAEPLPETLVPYPVCGVAVALYRGGYLASGLALAPPAGSGSLGDLIGQAARRASGQPRREEDQPPAQTADGDPDGGERPDLDESCAIVVTLLHDPEVLGGSAGVAAAKLRRGLDALIVREGDRHAAALPSAIPYNNLTKRELVATLAASPGLTGQDRQWCTYRTTAWLGRERGVHPLRFGFPRREPDADDHVAAIELLAGHIVKGLGPDGLPAYYLDPVAGKTIRKGTTARLVSGLVALEKAGRLLHRDDWVAAARPGLAYCLDHVGRGQVPGGLVVPGHQNGLMADCVLLEGATAPGSTVVGHPAVDSLTERVFSLLRPDGRICSKPVRLGVQQDHDFLPGAALLAVATAGHASLREEWLDAGLRWNRGRFRTLYPWGMAGWQPQAWAAAWRLTGDTDQARFVFEVADWAVDRQVARTGAFLEDLSYRDPSFNTGFVAEGIAAAWRVATDCGDAQRQARYRRSWQQAMRFLGTLIVRSEDTFCMPDPDQAMGGVRTSITRSDIRIDAVSHTLQALVAGIAMLGT
jgi:orotate phosphoribosyltransferase/AMMECR1 domain-containing protein